MSYWDSRYIILSVMLFAGNKICHPDLVLGCSEWIFGRYKASLKTVAASLSFMVWQKKQTQIGYLSFFQWDVISLLSLFSTKLGKCKNIFNAPLGRKVYQGIFFFNFFSKSFVFKDTGVQDIPKSFFLLILVRYDNFQPLVHEFIP